MKKQEGGVWRNRRTRLRRKRKRIVEETGEECTRMTRMYWRNKKRSGKCTGEENIKSVQPNFSHGYSAWQGC